ncbi:phage antirepressor KilAC domain-containing protein [Mycobacterium canetti]|uniref:phage antirepressor KilAC domain-containing protein n=1 Tax=Mycobacterium canetti TaxID=78331 RepID=UPI001E37BB9B|nr:phage antirepressor KilAC domain-containing protein [Mycobacterium canetti]
MTAADLTLPAARADRDRFAGRTDVLDKVGALRMLPGDLQVAGTDAVARFYEVTADVIRHVVHRNREELDDDGYQVLARAEVTELLSLTPDELGIPRHAGTAALFTRRCILRIGMLLRDSHVAAQVRDYLLDAETVQPLALPQDYPSALRALADEFEARQLAEARAKELETPAAAWNQLAAANGDYSVADAAKILSRDPHVRDIGQNRLFRHMHHINWCYRGPSGRWCAYQAAVDHGWLVERPGDRYHDKRADEYRLSEPTIRITPNGLAQLRKRLSGGKHEQLQLVVVS